MFEVSELADVWRASLGAAERHRQLRNDVDGFERERRKRARAGCAEAAATLSTNW
jgi:hypothetical protein